METIMLPDLPAPGDIRDFARSLGWEVLPDVIIDGRFVMGNPNFARRQIIVPLDARVEGYGEASSLAIEKLAEIHGLRAADALERVRTVGDDLMQLRVASAGASDDSLPLSFAAHMLRGVEEVLRCAACTVLRPLAHHPDLYQEDANRLVEQAQLRHTQRGSFVRTGFVRAREHARRIRGCAATRAGHRSGCARCLGGLGQDSRGAGRLREPLRSPRAIP
jgi:hypothetical protein